MMHSHLFFCASKTRFSSNTCYMFFPIFQGLRKRAASHWVSWQHPSLPKAALHVTQSVFYHYRVGVAVHSLTITKWYTLVHVDCSLKNFLWCFFLPPSLFSSTGKKNLANNRKKTPKTTTLKTLTKKTPAQTLHSVQVYRKMSPK